MLSTVKRKGAHKFYESLGYQLDVVQGFKKYLPMLLYDGEEREKWD
jgi:hypothetical protein